MSATAHTPAAQALKSHRARDPIFRSAKYLPQKARNAFEASQATPSKHLLPGWFSRRVHTDPDRNVAGGPGRTIKNARPKMRRNAKVSVMGGPVQKFKTTAAYRAGMPIKLA